MNNNFKAIILHGTGGNPTENWFPWLASELESLGVTTICPMLPTPQNQNLDVWLREFNKQVGKIDENTIIIGHSLAPAFLLRYLSCSNIFVKASFFVAGFMSLLNIDEFDKLNNTFVIGSLNWSELKEKVGNCYLYNSIDDPYVPLDLGRDLASHLNANFIEIENGGHLNSSAGFIDFPMLLKDIVNELNLDK